MKPCGVCLAKLLLNSGRGNVIGNVRPRSGPNGETPPAKRLASWNVDDVCRFLATLELQHVEASFRTNAVDGLSLESLSEEDLRVHLGLSALQARKVIARRPQ